MARPVDGTGDLAGRRIAVQTPRPIPGLVEEVPVSAAPLDGQQHSLHDPAGRSELPSPGFSGTGRHPLESAERLVGPSRFKGTVY